MSAISFFFLCTLHASTTIVIQPIFYTYKMSHCIVMRLLECHSVMTATHVKLGIGITTVFSLIEARSPIEAGPPILHSRMNTI